MGCSGCGKARAAMKKLVQNPPVQNQQIQPPVVPQKTPRQLRIEARDARIKARNARIAARNATILAQQAAEKAKNPVDKPAGS